MALIFLRSLVFNLVFYVALVLWMIFALPTFLMPRPALMTLVDLWARSNIWLMRIICGIKVEYRGVEKIPKGPLIIAAKHQSMWETFGLLQFFDHPLYILKRELEWLPLFGQYLRKAEMIGIDRKAGGKALLAMMRRARQAVRDGGQLIIFPEGTRRPVGAPPAYKSGFSQIYIGCGVTCLPVALNSGLFWPRRTFLRYPGTLTIEFLDPLPPGLPRQEFIDKVSHVIEEATDRLVESARQEQAQLFGRVPDSVKA